MVVTTTLVYHQYLRAFCMRDHRSEDRAMASIAAVSTIRLVASSGQRLPNQLSADCNDKLLSAGLDSTVNK